MDILNESNQSSSTESENNTVIESLKMYKDLNKDLSNKVQNLKIELSKVINENTKLKVKLLEEDQKNRVMKKYFSLFNLHNRNYINNYVTTMQQMAEDEIQIELAVESEGIISQYNNLQTTTRRENEHQRQRPEENPDNLQNNLLNTILEESRNESNSFISSTPFQRVNSNMTRSRLHQSMDSVSSIFDDNEKLNLLESSYEIQEKKSNRLTDNHVYSETNDAAMNDEEEDDNDCTLRPNSVNEDETISTIHSVNDTEETKKDESKTLQECSIVVDKCKISETMCNTLQSNDDDEKYLKSGHKKSQNRKRKSPESKNIKTRHQRKAKPDSNMLKEKSLKCKLRRH
ncbi:hypothetical protein PVAND_001151 [Polypedilum vanderplanki]|uniref:Uncharacterized protein n=1 Tax=Polypedilum vanderplanki TaxID=319348 RepID=A0A9J6BMC5_POLVA|nr:hypothetical protein PVAND_001151 [Polypedilum vanderplanki]